MKIICEAGLNWNNFNEAIQYCDTAKEVGADFVKFQIVENKELPQLTFGEWKVIKRYCDEIGIEFLATPSSQEIIEFLENIGCKYIKIGSDRVYDGFLFSNDIIIISSAGYYNRFPPSGNVKIKKLYCVSLYPCQDKYIKWQDMEGFDGFSDHTLRYDKEWCDKIKSKNFEYYEKHMSLGFNEIDKCVSLTKDQFSRLVRNLR